MHPIVEQLTPSPEQRPAIEARGRDVVVVAGAGTGKTRTLVARYLSLLCDGLSPREIVAVTFTRKAAREMRNRVRGEVQSFLGGADGGGPDRGRWQRTYAELDAARIGTIHALCSEILRAHPAEADLDPRFVPLDEAQTILLRGDAVDSALAWAADDGAASCWFGLLGERGLRAALDALLADRLAVRDVIALSPGDVLARWEAALARARWDALRAFDAGAQSRTAVATLASNSADRPDDLLERLRVDALAAAERLRRAVTQSAGEAAATGDVIEALAADLEASIGAIKLSGGSAAKWPGGKDQVDEVKRALKTLREAWAEAVKVVGLRATPADEEIAAAYPALVAIFDVAERAYGDMKRARNALDFDDLEQDALRLLEVNPEVRHRWQKDMRAVLVDEFQDTNDRQRRLIDLLVGDEAKVFVVGDAKQSIYRFRGADVAVFRSVRDAVGTRGGLVQPLAVSRRAHEHLVNAHNALLAPVLGASPDPARPYLEPFAALSPLRADAAVGLAAPYVALLLTIGAKAGGALDRAADVLAAHLVGLVRHEPPILVTVDGLQRRLDFGDVAVLCRSSGSFAAYEDALERAGVPFLTVAGRGFFGRPEVRDLLGCLRCLADPADDLALAGALRSPAFAVSDAGLVALAAARKARGAAASASLWTTLVSGEVDFDADDGARAARAASDLAALRTLAGRVPVGELLKALLDRTGYRAGLRRAGQDRAVRNVNKLLTDALALGMVSVGEFGDYVSSVQGAGAREGEARALAEGAVQIMSVHAAKGLEFPVIVLGDITYSGGGRDGGPLVDRDLGVLVPVKNDDESGTLPASYRLGLLRARDEEAAESDRLLYVAATRSRELLLLSGCATLRQSKPTLLRAGGWLGRMVAPLGLDEVGLDDYREDGDRALSFDLVAGGEPVACTVYEPGYRSVIAGPSAVDRPDAAGRPDGPVRAHALPAAPQPEVGAGAREATAGATRPGTDPWPLLVPVGDVALDVDEVTRTADRDPPPREWWVVPDVARPRAPAWVIGVLVHEALAAWRFPDAGFHDWVEARIRQSGVIDRDQIEGAIRRAVGLLERFRADPLCSAMATAERRMHEVPYVRPGASGSEEVGQVDALFRAHGRWTLVEFKTDHVRDDAALAELLSARDEGAGYLGQVRRYASAFEHFLGERPSVRLCLLDFAGWTRVLDEHGGDFAVAPDDPRDGAG